MKWIGLESDIPSMAMLSPYPMTTPSERGLAVENRPPLCDFDAIYRKHFDFVWRSVRRLGVPASVAEDAAQEVFVVIHRRLGEYEPTGSIRPWIFAIVRGVAANARRALARRPTTPDTELGEATDECPSGRPDAQAERNEAVAILHDILSAMDDDKREAFVLAELEQMSAPEIADALGLNLNTVYSRVRAARGNFKEAVSRHHARDRRRA